MVRNKMLRAIMFIHNPLNFAIAEIKHSDISNLMVSSWFTVAEELRQQELEAARHRQPHRQFTERNECRSVLSLPSPLSAGLGSPAHNED